MKTRVSLKYFVNKIIKAKENFANNQFHNILRLFEVLPNFAFIARETRKLRKNKKNQKIV